MCESAGYPTRIRRPRELFLEHRNNIYMLTILHSDFIFCIDLRASKTAMSDNLNELLRTHIAEKLDANIVTDILRSPPFIQVEGLFNLRDISDGTQSRLKRNYCFRSGTLENITEVGKNDLKQLGIETIFDLRSARETKAFPDPHIDDIIVVAAQTETNPLQATKYGSVR